jgi:hypothetical protein
VGKLFEAVTGLINNLLGLKQTKTIMQELGDIITKQVVEGVKSLNVALEQTKTAIDTITKMVKGDWKGALGNFDDTSFIGVMSKLFRGDFSGSWEGTKKSFDQLIHGNNSINNNGNFIGPPSYLYPQSSTQTNNTSITSSPTINVYGSDPKATADAVQDNIDSRTIRSMRGLIR